MIPLRIASASAQPDVVLMWAFVIIKSTVPAPAGNGGFPSVCASPDDEHTIANAVANPIDIFKSERSPVHIERLLVMVSGSHANGARQPRNGLEQRRLDARVVDDR